MDTQNHTGHSQVLEEWTYDTLNPVYGTTTPDSVRYYTIGDDVLSQANDTEPTNPQYLLYDGHGSTRQLLDHTYNVDGNGKPVTNDSYNYDGYGVMLGDSSQPADNAQTNLLYCGEQYDSSIDQYYLRARYYDPLNGRFNQMDTFKGDQQDPQSLHKYLYCHNDPINGIDPSGLMTLGEIITVTLTAISLTLTLGPPVLNIARSAKQFYELANYRNFIRNLAIQGVIDFETETAIIKEAVDATKEIIESLLNSLYKIAMEIVRSYIYSLAFAAVTKAVVGGIQAGVQMSQKAQAILTFGRESIHGHHTIFKCAVKSGLKQRKFWLPITKHVGAPDGLHYIISTSRRFSKLQPTNGINIKQVIRNMGGAQQWLDELGECYKWLETQDAAYKGIYEAFQKSYEWIGGAQGIINVT